MWRSRLRKPRPLTLLCMGFALLLWAKPILAQNIDQLNHLIDRSWFALREGQRLQDSGYLKSAFKAYEEAVHLTRRTLDMAKFLDVYQRTPPRVFYQAGHAHLGISEILLQVGANSREIWQELNKAHLAFESTLHFLYKKPVPEDPKWRQRVSMAHFYLGIISMNLGEFAMAHRELERALNLGYGRAAVALRWLESGSGQQKIPEGPHRDLSGSRLWEYVKAIAGIFLPKWGRLATMVLEDVSRLSGR